MKNKRIYVKVKNKNEKEAYLFEFPIGELFNGSVIQFCVKGCKTTVFIEDKGLSNEDITSFSCVGETQECDDYVRELIVRKKQAE